MQKYLSEQEKKFQLLKAQVLCERTLKYNVATLNGHSQEDSKNFGSTCEQSLRHSPRASLLIKNKIFTAEFMRELGEPLCDDEDDNLDESTELDEDCSEYPPGDQPHFHNTHL